MNSNAPHTDESPEQDDAVIGRALSISLAVFLAIGAVAAVVVGIYVFSSTKTVDHIEAPVAEAGKREASVSAVPSVTLTDVTAESGIAFTHANGAYGEKLLPETMGGGVATLDYDNDGDADLLLVNSTVWPWKREANAPEPTLALYANDGKGKFTDVTKEAGLAISLYGMGVAVATTARGSSATFPRRQESTSITPSSRKRRFPLANRWASCRSIWTATAGRT
jgi:hypothetical protein